MTKYSCILPCILCISLVNHLVSSTGSATTLLLQCITLPCILVLKWLISANSSLALMWRLTSVNCKMVKICHYLTRRQHCAMNMVRIKGPEATLVLLYVYRHLPKHIWSSPDVTAMLWQDKSPFSILCNSRHRSWEHNPEAASHSSSVVCATV